MVDLFGHTVEKELALRRGPYAGAGGRNAALRDAVVVAGGRVGGEGRPGRDGEGVEARDR